MKNFGITLVILGVAALVFGGLGYNRERTVFEVGGLKATATEHKTIPYYPILGVISLVGGIALIVATKRHA
jgi:hypothetical protein